MEYVVQAFKVLKNLVHAEANARAQKPGFFCRFPNPNTISLRDYQLILCMFGFLHELEHENCKLFPKVHLLLLQNGLWELACKFYVLINAKIQTYIKSIGNHAKKSYLG